MYPSIKSNAISEEEAIKICGKELVDIAMKANIHTIGDHTLRMPNMYYSSMMDMVKCIGSNPINALNSIKFFTFVSI